MGSCFQTVKGNTLQISMVVQGKRSIESCQKDREKRKGKAGNDICKKLEEKHEELTGEVKEDSSTEISGLSRLQKLLPSVSIKNNVTQLDIILEAIRYIDTLQFKLEEKNVSS